MDEVGVLLNSYQKTSFKPILPFHFSRDYIFCNVVNLDELDYILDTAMQSRLHSSI